MLVESLMTSSFLAPTCSPLPPPRNGMVAQFTETFARVSCPSDQNLYPTENLPFFYLCQNEKWIANPPTTQLVPDCIGKPVPFIYYYDQVSVTRDLGAASSCNELHSLICRHKLHSRYKSMETIGRLNKMYLFECIKINFVGKSQINQSTYERYDAYKQGLLCCFAPEPFSD